MNEFAFLPSDAAGREAVDALERLASSGAPTKKGPAKGAALPQPLPLQSASQLPIEHWSEQTLRDLIELLPDAVVVIDQGGVIVLVNEQTDRIFSYPRAEMLGQRIELLIPERYREGHVGHRNRYFEQPRSRPMGAKLELFGRRKDGTEFPVEISLSPLITERGVFATSVIRDISQRKRDEAKFRTLVENIPAVTFIAPLDESVPELYVSPQIEQLLGFSQKEWLEDPVLWYRQLHPDDRVRWNLQFAPTCASGQPFNSVYRFLAKDGRVVWVHGSASVVRDADGLPSFLQGVAFDITSIREAEQALRKAEERLIQANAELERRVEERTRELLAKAVELENFADVSSHDLKRPLGTIKSRLQMLATRYAGKLDEDADRWIQSAVTVAERLNQLIVKLLEYSKAVKTDRRLQPVDCNAIVRAVHESLLADIEECGAEVIVGKLPPVLGHHDDLIRLFQNLISNAIKYREPDRPLRVEIGARPKSDRWLFWVRDNGSGIEEKYLSKLFTLGTEGRVHKDFSKIPGHGYGLHICKTIVAGHEGTIEAESKYGEGTTFLFTLPAVPAQRTLGNG